MMVEQMTWAFYTALIGGLVAFMFWRIEKRIDQMERQSEQHAVEQIQMRKHERELLLATADLVMVISKKVQGYDVNGDLVEAEEELQRTKHDVADYTESVAIKRIEGVKM